MAAAAAASEATSATTPRRSRGGPSQWRRENPDLAVRQAEFFHSLWDDPGGAVAKEKSIYLSLSQRIAGKCWGGFFANQATKFTKKWLAARRYHFFTEGCSPCRAIARKTGLSTKPRSRRRSKAWRPFGPFPPSEVARLINDQPD